MFCNTGDIMRENCQSINSSIDKVLEYIEQDIENPDKKEGLEDLIDIHTLLTKIKVSHIEKVKTPNTQPDDLFIYSHLVISSFNIIFGTWECHTKATDERVLLYNDLIYLDINRDNGYTQCIISFYYQTNPVIVAEAINLLKDLFGLGLKVSSETFTTNDATGDYIWGEEAIQEHIRAINGLKIKPIVCFDDGTVGHS